MMVADVDPNYRDIQERTEYARKQQQIANWQAEVRRLHQAAQWAAVVAVGERLQALDPAAADPDGLVSSARATLAARVQTHQLEADYQTALRLLDTGNWRQAIQALERVAQVNPAYRATPVLLERARSQLAASNVPKVTQAPSMGKRSEQRPREPTTQTVLHVPQPRSIRVGQPVNAVAFSPDGTQLATGSLRTLRIWNLRTESKPMELQVGRLEQVEAVAFSSDGTRLATCGNDKTVRIWDATTGQPQLRIIHDSGVFSSVHGVAFSPDGTRLATCGNDKTARIWDAITGQQQLKIIDAGYLYGVAFSPDGTRLATCGDKIARIWDATTGRQQRLQVIHNGDVRAVAFSPDGTRLATCGEDKTARIWDATTGQQQLEVIHGGYVFAVAFSPDGTRLATGSRDKTARIWDATTGQQQLEVIHGGYVRAVAFSPDGTRLATGSNDKTARISDIVGG
jgi:WD40 repeat protein